SKHAMITRRIPLGSEEDQSYENVGRLPIGPRVPHARILPTGTHVAGFGADIWIPNWLDPNAEAQNNHTHSAIGITKPGVTIEQVGSDLKRVEKQVEAVWPGLG